jgi:hypothetical protein
MFSISPEPDHVIYRSLAHNFYHLVVPKDNTKLVVERCSVGFSKKCKSKVQHQYVTFNIAEK